MRSNLVLRVRIVRRDQLRYRLLEDILEVFSTDLLIANSIFHLIVTTITSPPHSQQTHPKYYKLPITCSIYIYF